MSGVKNDKRRTGGQSPTIQRGTKSKIISDSVPCRSLMIRNLYSVDFDENELEDFISEIAIEAGFSPPSNVNIPSEKSTGRTKGFAFVDFPHEDAAIKFMEYTKAVLRIADGHFPLCYAQKRDEALPSKTDWLCLRCQFMNFSRRESCKSCGVPRDVGCHRPDNKSQASRATSIDEQAFRVLQLCPGLVPDGEKYYTDDPDRIWLFDPQTLYWYNKRLNAYFRESDTNETCIRRVDEKGRFIDSSGDVPLPARTIPIRTDTRDEPVDHQSVKKQRHEQLSSAIPLGEKVVVVNPSESTTCLLCSRKFDSVEALKKHENLSDLHRENLRKRRRQ